MGISHRNLVRKFDRKLLCEQLENLENKHPETLVKILAKNLFKHLGGLFGPLKRFLKVFKQGFKTMMLKKFYAKIRPTN